MSFTWPQRNKFSADLFIDFKSVAGRPSSTVRDTKYVRMCELRHMWCRRICFCNELPASIRVWQSGRITFSNVSGWPRMCHWITGVQVVNVLVPAILDVGVYPSEQQKKEQPSITRSYCHWAMTTLTPQPIIQSTTGYLPCYKIYFLSFSWCAPAQ